MQSELYPSPHFEGVEKRIEINFRVAADDNKSTGGIIPVAGGLRCLSRAALDVWTAMDRVRAAGSVILWIGK